MISYEPFWNTLKKKGISQYKLVNTYGVSTGTMDSLRKNRSMTLNTINDLCSILNCQIEEVVLLTPDDKSTEIAE